MKPRIFKISVVLGIVIAIFAASVALANFSGLIAKIKKPLFQMVIRKSLPSDCVYITREPVQNESSQKQAELIQTHIIPITKPETKKATLKSTKEKPIFTQANKNENSIYSQDVFLAEGVRNQTETNKNLFVGEDIKIIIKSLPEAIICEKYNTRLTTRGGSPPYKWKLSSGRLPLGIYLDEEAGVLYGMPEKCEVATFTIIVTDDKGSHNLFNFTLVVLKYTNITDAAGPLSIVTNSLTDAIVGRDYYKQMLAKGGWPPYSWVISAGALPKNLCLHNKSGVLYGVPQKEGKAAFTIKVIDRKDNFAQAELTLLIKTSPLYIISGSLPGGCVGLFYSQRLEAQGGFPPYKWQIISGSLPEGISFDSHCALLSGIPQKSQKTAFKVKVTDTEDNYDIAEFMINVNEKALEIVDTSLERGVVGANYYQALCAQGGQPPYKWQTANLLPDGLLLNKESGSISGTPLDSTDMILNITVTDKQENKARADLELVILDELLTICEPFSFKADVGEEFCKLLCACGGSPPYKWEIASGELPQGITLDKNEGILNGMPLKAETAKASIKVIDQHSDMASADFTFEIQDTELSIVTTGLPSLEIDENCSFCLEAEGGVPPYQWQFKSGSLPAGLSLNTQGLLNGMPTEGGNFSFEIEVTDANKDSALSTFSLMVKDNSLSITTSALPDGERSVEYYFALIASGGTTPYSWRISRGGLPEGIALAETTGVLSGTPAKGQTLSVTIEIEDAKGNIDEAEFQIKITGDPLFIVTSELAEGVVGKSYSQPLLADGGVQPYFWKIVAGSLPQGLSLNSHSGLIAGIPESETTETIEFEVSDETADCIRSIFSLTINENEEPLTITTEDLPSAKVHRYYEVALEAQGGVLPYTWSLVDSSLPQGLTLDGPAGKISGTCEVTGDFPLLIQVKDDEDNKQTKDFTLSIKDIPPSIAGFIICPSDGKVGLAWVNPDNNNFSVVKIFRSTVGYPQSPEEGELVYAGTEDNIIDTNLTNSFLYYYCAFAFDEEGAYSDITDNSRASATPKAVTLYGDCDPFVDEVISFNPLAQGGFGASNMPQVVLGSPQGLGSSVGSVDVVSLHSKINDDGTQTPPYGGSITLKFNDNIVVNAEGLDFTVFENVFYVGGDPQFRWMEPATVSVSQDGIIFYTFSIDFVPHYDQDDQINCYNPFCYSKGFAGINPVYSSNGSPNPADPSVSGGDSFDLSDITVKDLKWVSYVRITATGDDWLLDCNGNKVRHVKEMSACSGVGSSGFDLDAVCAINY